MDEEKEDERELSVTEGAVKVVVAALAAFLVKHFVEKAIESEFRKRHDKD